MNCYEAMMEMVQIDKDMESLSSKLSKATNTKEREVLEKQIGILDVRFVELKHALQDTELKL